MKILGHHHVSIHTKDIQLIDDFYRHILGFRRVKKTVNQEDTSMYHLFYGDKVGTAGTEMTFFEIPDVGTTYRGTNAISHVGLLVPTNDSLKFWKRRFETHEVFHHQLTTVHGRKALFFEDPDRLQIYLYSNEGFDSPPNVDWDFSTEIPPEHRLLGLGPVTLSVRDLGKSREILTNVLGYQEVVSGEKTAIFRTSSKAAYGEIILRELPGEREKSGRGSVHHMALSVKGKKELENYAELLSKKGIRHSGIVDRFYFSSLYFRDPNSILYELATEGPGFTIDSSVETLGQKLDLPPFLEENRYEIEKKLTPIP
ncbi:ring-cleaving dioxygenase [Vagococcus elongatus]|uniref:Ring-cleaving dioxygenase n=1 Tax=Vagococcus elongatus TaxID=180344 RepID=A0A430B4P3_9ENTE|nr:ring-cleaving dioxygenase [Vagococcus elongatus]RSU15269.1 ring-cleaving dioxygenase [Vagococcus elongatus]